MALRQLLTQCRQGNEAGALVTLRLNPGIINDPRVGEGFDGYLDDNDDDDGDYFYGGGGEWVEQGDTAIMAASKGGSERLVRELLRLGADVNARSNGRGYEGWNALMYATRFGHAAGVAVLLDNGADVNARSDGGWDALMYASEKGDAAVVAVLLDNGADPNTRNHEWTDLGIAAAALGLAAARDHLPVCQLLLGRGANLLTVNIYDKDGEEGGNALEIYGHHSHHYGSGDALDVYGSNSHLPPAILEERREALRVAFAEGPRESQVQRRRDERWARRWPFMLVLAGSGFRPLEARRLEMALRLLSVSEPSGGEAAGAPLTRRDECVRIVFRADNLVRLIVSFL